MQYARLLVTLHIRSLRVSRKSVVEIEVDESAGSLRRAVRPDSSLRPSSIGRIQISSRDVGSRSARHPDPHDILCGVKVVPEPAVQP